MGGPKDHGKLRTPPGILSAKAMFQQLASKLGTFLYRRDGLLSPTLQNMPVHTEVRIQQLYTEALAAKTLADVDRILPELRSALEEHVKLAKESLETQIATIASLDAASQIAKGLSKE